MLLAPIRYHINVLMSVDNAPSPRAVAVSREKLHS